MNFGWDFYNSLRSVFVSKSNPSVLYNTNVNEYVPVPAGKTKLRFTSNHDLSNERTPIGVFGSKQAALAASAATIFMNGTPMIYCGQEVGVNQPSIYLSGQPIDWNVNPDMLSAYKDMLQYYNSSEIARSGTLNTINNPDFIVFTKTIGSNRMLAIINSRNSDKNYIVPENLQGSWENALTTQTEVLSGNLQLGAFEYLILKNN